MNSIARPASAVVIGATGGVGGAVVSELLRSGGFERVFAFARRPFDGPSDDERLAHGTLDVTEEGSIEQAARLVAQAPPVRLVFVATGLLHRGSMEPEKTYKRIDPRHLQEAFAVNAIGPALIAKHFLPILPRQGKAVFAALSARVGSISDNQLGGWYAYRASKAALNMLIRSLAIELARSHPDAVCVGLHPGTVDTGLSKPFQGGVPPQKLFTPEVSARHLLTVLDALVPVQSGGCFAWDGKPIPP